MKLSIKIFVLSLLLCNGACAYQDGEGNSGPDWTIVLRRAIENQSPDLAAAKEAISQLGDLTGSLLGVQWHGWHPLHACVGPWDPNGSTILDRIARILVINELDVNVQDARGLTPLHRAILAGNLRLISFFLAHGADPSIPTLKGENSVHLALSVGMLDFVRELAACNRGCQPDA